MSGDVVVLLGAADVERAGRQIQAAAASISSSVEWLREVLERDRAFRADQIELEHARRTEALDRFNGLVERLEKLAAGG